MKKAALLTFSDSYNYGAGLQAFATYKLLEYEGYQVKFINYRNGSEACPEKILGLARNITLIDNMKMIIKKTIFMGHINGKKGFEEFNNMLPRTKKYVKHTLSGFDHDYDFDYLIIGSDQVWNPLITGRNIDLSFWGDFTAKPKISISSSAGSYKYTKEDWNRIIPYLSEFKKITVREEFLRSQIIGKNIPADLILDPTLILGRKKWDELSDKYGKVNVPDKPYVFLYLVATKFNDCQQYVKFIKEKLNFEIVYVDKFNIKRNNVDHHFKTASPFDWVCLLKNAQYVLTDSFHGTAFSMMFHKNCSIVETNNSMRIKNLFELLNVKNRMFSSIEALCVNYNEIINFDEVDENLAQMQNTSINHIREAIDI